MARELMVMLSLTLLHALWVLLPLVPAVLIYHLFPDSKVGVSGPLANLTVRASGAFAGYLIVFLVTTPLVNRSEDTIRGFEHLFWTINGKVKLIGANGVEIKSADLLKKMEVHPDPSPYNIASYIVRLRVFEGEEGEFPFVNIDIPNFGQGVIDLKSISKNVVVDKYHKTIEIAEPIEVREFSPLKTGAIARINAPEARPNPEGPPVLELDAGAKRDELRQPVPQSR